MQSGIRSARVSTGLARLVIAFDSVEYRWLWSSAFFSSMSMGLWLLAQGWLVLKITDSPFWVGLVAGIQGLGLISFGAFGGTLVDRLDRRKVLALVYFASAGMTLTLGVLVLTDHIARWHLLVPALLRGGCEAINLPALNAMVYQIVGPRRLLNALAARMMGMNISKIVGSLIAGALIAKFGVGSCYLYIAGSSYLAAALVLMVRVTSESPGSREPFLRSMSQGMKYVWSNGPVRTLLLLSVVIEMFGFSVHVMMPVMARDVLEVGATGLGYLSATMGAGAMISTLVVAGLGDFRQKGVLVAATAAAAGLSIAFFALSPWFPVSLVAVAMVGGTLMGYDITMGAMLQLLSSDEVRGRVLGVYGLTYGFTPVGGLMAGAIASAATTPLALAVFGALIVAYVLRVSRPVASLRPTQETREGVPRTREGGQ